MIYVMRHGQSIVNLDHHVLGGSLDGDLTTLGYNQAHHAGLWLKDKSIQQIIASPFERTQKTAEIVGKVLKLKPLANDDLRSLDCGDLEGDDSTSAWYEIINRWRGGEWDLAFPNGETFRQVYDRFSRVLTQVTDNTLIISHGNIIESVLPFLCINAAALQRVGKPSHTGFVILESYDSRRFICNQGNRIKIVKEG